MALKQTTGEEILEFLRDNFGSGLFKSYFYGDPMQIAQSYLPAVIVERQRSSDRQGPTSMDRVRETIVIKLVLNKKDDFSKSDSVDLTQKRLEDLVEGRDSVTGKYLDESLKGVLRTKLTLGSKVIEQDNDVEYGVIPRSPDLLTAEAHLTITTAELVEISSRS